MTARPIDPLLSIAKIILLIGQGLTALGTLVLAVGLPLILLMQDEATARMREEFSDPNIVFPTLAVIGFVLFGIAILVMAFLFLTKMRRIVDSVGEGDPFVTENAARLTAMAWLMLAIQITAIPATAITLYLTKVFEEQEATIDAAIDLNGIVIVVLLFILARVFRHGTAMRDDLEGTV